MLRLCLLFLIRYLFVLEYVSLYVPSLLDYVSLILFPSYSTLTIMHLNTFYLYIRITT